MTRTALALAAAAVLGGLPAVTAQAAPADSAVAQDDSADSAGPTIGGGSGIVVDGRAACTLTTIGYDNADRLVGLTAGHCGKPGATVVADAAPGFGVIGRFAHSDPALDYAVIEFDPRRVNPVNRVGGTTGTSCGVTWGDLRATSTEMWTQMCVMRGDSGAPVVHGSTLVGMVNAYLAVGCFGPEVGTTLTAITTDLDARDDIGAGYRPV
ncbi:serine protease [Nocardia brasiliensis]|uniref:Serine protease n=1 Tax=Nocardia brasiliensis TaxID=37326 RepID=A0A6G9XMI7_NOCBR|nr:serine protease [Nocardia brasiliensis]QIS02116.1 serine protease [Nocardia brasiliensis]